MKKLAELLGLTRELGLGCPLYCIVNILNVTLIQINSLAKTNNFQIIGYKHKAK